MHRFIFDNDANGLVVVEIDKGDFVGSVDGDFADAFYFACPFKKSYAQFFDRKKKTVLKNGYFSEVGLRLQVNSFLLVVSAVLAWGRGPGTATREIRRNAHP